MDEVGEKHQIITNVLLTSHMENVKAINKKS